MNIAVNTTKSPLSPSPSAPERTRVEKDAAIADAMRLLEHDVYSVLMVSRIVDDMIEREFMPGVHRKTQDDETLIPNEVREKFAFLTAELRDRALNLDRAFQAALRGEVKQ